MQARLTINGGGRKKSCGEAGVDVEALGVVDAVPEFCRTMMRDAAGPGEAVERGAGALLMTIGAGAWIDD